MIAITINIETYELAVFIVTFLVFGLILFFMDDDEWSGIFGGLIIASVVAFIRWLLAIAINW